MPAALQTEITNLHLIGGYFTADLLTARNYLYAAGDYIAAQQWALAKSALYSAADYFGLAAGHFHATGDCYTHRDVNALQWINDNWPTGGVVTMSAINSAMLTATFAELQNFIGIEDAYRLALWNAPFNAEFYAALARGFQKWP